MISNNKELVKKAREETTKLAAMASKIEKIPDRFATRGNLDLDKVHLVLSDYHKGRIPK